MLGIKLRWREIVGGGGEGARYKSKWVIYFQSDLGSCEGCIVYLYWTILLRLACISCTRGLALILALMFLQIVSLRYFREQPKCLMSKCSYFFQVSNS